MEQPLTNQLSENDRSRHERLRSILVCPSCQARLNYVSKTCETCGLQFYIEGRHYGFLDRKTPPSRVNWLDQAKETVRTKWPKLYPTVVNIVSPVFSSERIEKQIPTPESGQLVLNLGAGTTSYGENVINVDCGKYQSIDVIADLTRLPFKSHSVDMILNIAVLEHVRDPRLVVKEFLRVLKPTGRGICFIPFMQGFHACPHDYQRFTPEGLKVLFQGFEIQKMNTIGPTSALLWMFQEWLALLLSFGSSKLYRLVLPLMWTLSPIKYIDVLLARHPEAKNIASGYFVYFKPEKTAVS